MNPLVWLFNQPWARYYLEINDPRKIVRVANNGVHFDNENGTYTAKFQINPYIAEKLVKFPFRLERSRLGYFYPVLQAGLAVTTYNPNAGGNGVVTCEKASSTWDAVHDETGTTGVSAATTAIAAGSTFINGTQYSISRGYLPFNTSSLGAGASGISADLEIYVDAKTNADNDGDDWINVVQTTQANPASLATADYDKCGSIDNPAEGSTRIDLGTLATSSYNTYTLNATGLTWVNSGGYTRLGLREGHDAIDSPVATGANTFSGQDAGDANPPTLEVTYTPGPPLGVPFFFA